MSSRKVVEMKEIVEYNGKQFELDYEILAPGIYVYHNAIPKEWDVVNRIESALAKENTRFSWKTANVSFDTTNQDYRKCKDFKINEQILSPRDEYSADILDLHAQVTESLQACLSHYKPRNYLAMLDYQECINIVRYGKGEYFKVHSDDGDPYRCTTSAVGYPNDNYEGGELFFTLFDIKYKPKAGDFVINPSAYSYAHSAEPVTDDGVKYSFVIMLDRNEFAHRNDSPIYYDQEYREQFNILRG